MRRTTLLFIIILQLIITPILFLAGAEIWARAFPPDDRSVWPVRFDPDLGFLFKPNSFVRWTNGLDFNAASTSNEAGFLDRPLPPIEKPPTTCRIAIIGDSFVEAAQVPIEKKVQVLLDAEAARRWPEKRFETFALGYSGTGQLNQLPFFDRFAKPRRPDLTVLVFVDNDFNNNSALLEGIRNGWDPNHTPRVFARHTEGGDIELQPIDPDWQQYEIAGGAKGETAIHRWLQPSRFYRWFHAKLSLLHPGMGTWLSGQSTHDEILAYRKDKIVSLYPELASELHGWRFPDPNGPGLDYVYHLEPTLPPAFAHALDYSRLAFRLFKQGAEEAGGRLLVVSTQHVKDRYFDYLRNMAGDLGIPVISMRDYMLTRDMKPEEANWPHDGHWNERGHEVMADLLLDFISQQNVCGIAAPAEKTLDGTP